MKRIFVLMLLTSLFCVSCNKSGGDSSSSTPVTDITNVDTSNPDAQNPTPEPQPAPIPAPAPAPVSTIPALALSFRTNVDYLSGFDSSDEEKYDEAVSIVKKVVATEAFKTKVLNHVYNGTKSYANNNGLSNAQIYQTILDAAEKLTPSKNNTLDVGVKLYYTNNSVVGYTSTSITYINVNTKFFDSYDPNEVAGNLFHEWLHKLGYGHDSTATTRRPYSVPYAIGYMIRDLGKNFL